jgi:hypothetical protein
MPTTNNNWPTPVATDLVKDGWEAIKDLGDAIDTTLGVYAPSTPGLTLINTTSFSGVASVSLPADTFTTTYNNYRLFINVTSVTATDYFALRLRASGSDITTGSYDCSFGNFSHGASTVSNDNSGVSQTSWSKFAYAGSGINAFNATVDLFNPKLATPTGYTGFATNAADEHWVLGGRYTGLNVADSVTLFRTTGNMTGSIVTYAYNI